MKAKSDILEARPSITVPSASGTSSASAKKLEAFGITLDNLEAEKLKASDSTRKVSEMFLLVQYSSLASFFATLLCPTCSSVGVVLKVLQDVSCGFALKATLFCENCATNLKEDYLCQRTDSTKSTKAPFEVNTRATLAFRGIGCGFSAMKEWCGTMNIPQSMSLDSYYSHQAKIHDASLTMVENIKKQSLTAIMDAYKDIGVHSDQNGILNIAVSFDGAWQRRGHSSHNGLASVIDLLTGLPVDFEVLSNFCFKCKAAAERPDDPSWQEKHLPKCLKNYDGSANSMEVECALRMWRRSIEVNKLRYTIMLCDGDSKSFDAVVQEKPYGDQITIEKEDCINHVAKRMGTALRNLVSETKAQKESISGKGKLTQEKIVKIQNYYGRAVKDNAGDIDMSRKRIYAILFHLSSSDQHPKHMHCPTGEKSWCFWQRACAKGQHPASHKEHETLPSTIGKKLVPVFDRLSNPELLKRCSRHRTQNPNEALHHLIWKVCPKHTYVSKNTMETAVAISLSQFSMGASFREIILQLLKIQPGIFLEKASIEKDISRLKKAENAAQESTKKRRRMLKFQGKIKDQRKKVAEGPTYAAGAFYDTS